MEVQAKTRSAGRIALVISGAAVALVALAAATGGGALVWADKSQRSADGYFSTGAQRFQTGTRALAAETLSIGSDVPQWLYDNVRIRATSNGGKPVFVGIARQADVDRYLAGVSHAQVRDIDFDPFKTTYVPVAGARSPAVPSNWSLVVMNADSSPGVSAGVSAGFKAGYALWAGIGLLIGGTVLLFGATGFIYFGSQRRPPGLVTATPQPAV